MKWTFYLKILQSLFLYMGIVEMTSTAKSGRTTALKKNVTNSRTFAICIRSVSPDIYH